MKTMFILICSDLCITYIDLQDLQDLPQCRIDQIATLLHIAERVVLSTGKLQLLGDM